jgi:hypothetical protein
VTPSGSVRELLIPEVVRPGMRLGRHVRHDPRSVAYRVARTATPETVIWERKIPILDQGDLGSCTGNATVGVLGTEPYFSLLSADQQASLSEDLAVAIYSGGTQRDTFPGVYPPEDTGSDGLSVAQEAKARGLISGYQHVMSVGEAHAAIQSGPFITGTLWFDGMFEPDSRGVVVPKGKPAGGHEYEVRGYDLTVDEWIFDNSWTTGWGVGGSFRMKTEHYAYLLAQQGDGTTFVPITAPAPQPAPEPIPAPDPLSGFPFLELDKFAAAKKPYWTRLQKQAADSYTSWRGHFNA